MVGRRCRSRLAGSESLAEPASAVEPRRSRRAPPCSFTEPTYDGDAAQFPFHFLPYRVAAVLRRVAGAPAVAAGAARSDDLGDVEQLGRNQSEDRGEPRHRARRHRRNRLVGRRASGRRRSSIPASRRTSSRCRSGKAIRRSRGTRRDAARIPIEILAPVAEAETGALAWAATRVKVARVGDPDGTLILFSARRRAAREAARRGDAVMAHRWGMAVDLDRCTGCEACVTACHAENNIATVGELQAVARPRDALDPRRALLRGRVPGRQGEVPAGDVPAVRRGAVRAGLPDLREHHNEDGLNAQIYNRCIGTRYCANACPYNVRFFDFFNPAWDKPLHLQLNPDVSVREVGVMEKCTFCTQRITAAKITADGREARR